MNTNGVWGYNLSLPFFNRTPNTSSTPAAPSAPVAPPSVTPVHATTQIGTGGVRARVVGGSYGPSVNGGAGASDGDGASGRSGTATAGSGPNPQAHQASRRTPASAGPSRRSSVSGGGARNSGMNTTATADPNAGTDSRGWQAPHPLMTPSTSTYQAAHPVLSQGFAYDLRGALVSAPPANWASGSSSNAGSNWNANSASHSQTPSGAQSRANANLSSTPHPRVHSRPNSNPSSTPHSRTNSRTPTGGDSNAQPNSGSGSNSNSNSNWHPQPQPQSQPQSRSSSRPNSRSNSRSTSNATPVSSTTYSQWTPTPMWMSGPMPRLMPSPIIRSGGPAPPDSPFSAPAPGQTPGETHSLFSPPADGPTPTHALFSPPAPGQTFGHGRVLFSSPVPAPGQTPRPVPAPARAAAPAPRGLAQGAGRTPARRASARAADQTPAPPRAPAQTQAGPSHTYMAPNPPTTTSNLYSSAPWAAQTAPSGSKLLPSVSAPSSPPPRKIAPRPKRELTHSPLPPPPSTWALRLPGQPPTVSAGPPIGFPSSATPFSRAPPPVIRNEEDRARLERILAEHDRAASARVSATANSSDSGARTGAPMGEPRMWPHVPAVLRATQCPPVIRNDEDRELLNRILAERERAASTGIAVNTPSSREGDARAGAYIDTAGRHSYVPPFTFAPAPPPVIRNKEDLECLNRILAERDRAASTGVLVGANSSGKEAPMDEATTHSDVPAVLRDTDTERAPTISDHQVVPRLNRILAEGEHATATDVPIAADAPEYEAPIGEICVLSVPGGNEPAGTISNEEVVARLKRMLEPTRSAASNYLPVEAHGVDDAAVSADDAAVEDALGADEPADLWDFFTSLGTFEDFNASAPIANVPTTTEATAVPPNGERLGFPFVSPPKPATPTAATPLPKGSTPAPPPPTSSLYTSTPRSWSPPRTVLPSLSTVPVSSGNATTLPRQHFALSTSKDAGPPLPRTEPKQPVASLLPPDSEQVSTLTSGLKLKKKAVPRPSSADSGDGGMTGTTASIATTSPTTTSTTLPELKAAGGSAPKKAVIGKRRIEREDSEEYVPPSAKRAKNNGKKREGDEGVTDGGLQDVGALQAEKSGRRKKAKGTVKFATLPPKAQPKEGTQTTNSSLTTAIEVASDTTSPPPNCKKRASMEMDGDVESAAKNPKKKYKNKAPTSDSASPKKSPLGTVKQLPRKKGPKPKAKPSLPIVTFGGDLNSIRAAQQRLRAAVAAPVPVTVKAPTTTAPVATVTAPVATFGADLETIKAVQKRIRPPVPVRNVRRCGGVKASTERENRGELCVPLFEVTDEGTIEPFTWGAKSMCFYCEEWYVPG